MLANGIDLGQQLIDEGLCAIRIVAGNVIGDFFKIDSRLSTYNELDHCASLL